MSGMHGLLCCRYLAPECCRAKWHPASDVWAVGVMACYLLTGAYPFLDRISPKMPDLARTLRRWEVGGGRWKEGFEAKSFQGF